MLLTSPPPDGAVFDLCVVGAGPVGLSLALEAAGMGLRILLVEAGGETRRWTRSTPPDSTVATVLDPDVHAALSDTTWRGLGGGSWLWGGRCVPFEPVDFAARRHVPHSGWPISAADVSPWQETAARYLDCGRADFRADPLDGWHDGPVCTSHQERWSRRLRVGRELGTSVAAHPAIALLTEASVVDIRFDACCEAVTGLVIRHHGQDGVVAAGAYVLACGGIATTRLLLDVQGRHSELFGGPDGPLGHFYMGHLTGSIAALEISQPEGFPALDFYVDRGGAYARRRFSLSERAQQEHELLNISFFLGNLPFWDHRHGNGALSLFFMVLTIPFVGRRLVSAETWRRNVGSYPRNRRRHLRNVARRPWRVIRDVTRVLYWRCLAVPRRRVFVLRSDTGMYSLRYHSEQSPNPQSRVSLNGNESLDGLAGIDIDFRYSEQDVDSVLRSHALLDEQLRATGFGRLDYLDPESRRKDAIKAQASDGYHQIGTTRMSEEPSRGVVDRNCKVHGVDNLFVASSSVFPTGGEANPTFMAVSLAVRLAHHLAERSNAPG